MKVAHIKPHALLNDWRQYKNLHYSQKTRFANAVDIEIEKDAVAECANRLLTILSQGRTNKTLLSTIDEFETHLKSLKDQITIELLKNGN